MTGRPRQRVPIRLVNAAVDTAFRVALGGHRLIVTHTDGFPATPTTGDALVLGMGERVRLEFVNETTMFHPMHVHGHTFAVAGSGTRKDTVVAVPKQTVTVDFDANNPGQWMTHCHNIYHAESGMMANLAYRA